MKYDFFLEFIHWRKKEISNEYNIPKNTIHNWIKNSYQKIKSYDLNSVLEILKFQQKNNYTNTYTADKFKISRNTVAKWRKIYEYKKTVSKRNRFFYLSIIFILFYYFMYRQSCKRNKCVHHINNKIFIVPFIYSSDSKK